MDSINHQTESAKIVTLSASHVMDFSTITVSAAEPTKFYKQAHASAGPASQELQEVTVPVATSLALPVTPMEAARLV